MTDEQTAAAAAELYASIRFSSSHSANIAAIVRALQAARTPPPGHIIDDAGVVRKVLGTLPITKDGCVVGDDCRVWQDGQMWNTELFRVPTGSNGRWAPYRTNKVYSSEAAEAAKEGKA